MNGGPIDIYYSQIVRAVVGGQPVIVGREANPTALRAICARLVQAEEALQILAHKGYGKPGDRIDEIAAALPAKIIGANVHDIWTTK